jgi:hypothetical protein
VPVNSQALFGSARNLLIAYLFCWHTPRRNRENRNHFPLSKAETSFSFRNFNIQLSIRPSPKSLSISAFPISAFCFGFQLSQFQLFPAAPW